MKFRFTKEGIIIEGRKNTPLGEIPYKEIFQYDKLPVRDITIKISSINREIDSDGNLKAIVLDIDSFKPVESQIETSENYVTAGDFEHIGEGIFVLKRDRFIRITVKKKTSMRDLENQLKRHNLWNKNYNGLLYGLKTRAGWY